MTTLRVPKDGSGCISARISVLLDARLSGHLGMRVASARVDCGQFSIDIRESTPKKVKATL